MLIAQFRVLGFLGKRRSLQNCDEHEQHNNFHSSILPPITPAGTEVFATNGSQQVTFGKINVHSIC
jgi:hypothetical protein